MYRGTTPTLYLELETDLELEEVAEMWVTFKTPSVEVTKTLDEIIIDTETNVVTVTLTQEDTLSLYRGIAEVQVRIRMNSDLAYASEIAQIDVEKVLKEGVI